MAPAGRIARLIDGNRVFHALLDGERIRELPGDLSVGFGRPGAARPIGDAIWLPPCRPSKIIGIGRNYRTHAAELGHEPPREPLLFLKPTSSLLPHGGVIRLPAASRRVDFEGELAVVISRRARHVPEDRVPEYLFGYTCLNDVTARDLQKRDLQFTRAKGFDTFCPLGPCIATGLDPGALSIRTLVNGQVRQESSTARMIFGVAVLVSYVSRIMTLEPGDVLATGTPAGVGPLADGDEVSIVIDGIGALTNRVAIACDTEQGADRSVRR